MSWPARAARHGRRSDGRRAAANTPGLGRAPHEADGITTPPCTEMAGRACHAVELSPAYVDVAVLRWQAFTGGQAALERGGRPFAAVAGERLDAVGV